MPLYEYECDACGHRFEVIQKYADPPIHICPACGGSVQKLLSSPAIQFKGSGWYITDYARAGKTDGDKASQAKTDGTPTAGDSKTADAKPAESKGESGADAKSSKTETKSDTPAASKSETKASSPKAS